MVPQEEILLLLLFEFTILIEPFLILLFLVFYLYIFIPLIVPIFTVLDIYKGMGIWMGAERILPAE